MSKLLYKLKSGTEAQNFGRQQVIELAGAKLRSRKLTILDLGAGHGTDLLNVAGAAKGKVEMLAVESFPLYVKELKKAGAQVLIQDLESEKLKLPDASVDIIIANQILEHTKEIFWIFSEVSRLLKPGGILIIGVPNLASLHNRVALLVGKQPTAITVLGAHVRGYTYPSFKKFIECDDFFTVTGRLGANFYPFPSGLSTTLSKLLPSMAVGLFMSVERTKKKGNFISVLDNHFFETPYRTAPDKK